jgi:RloB-like protein
MNLGRNRYRRPGRRPAFRAPRKKLLIVCEGANTEPQYFIQFAEVHRNAIVDVDLAPERGVPLSVVREAKRLKNQAISAAKREGDPYLRYDSVWCVFDVDEHPNVPEALAMARQNGLNVAVSNPCFELWLILHLREAPGMIHRHAAQAMLKALLPGYDKKVDYKDYRGGYERAVERATRLDKLATDVGKAGRNPTTGVYKLTETIAPPKEDSDSQRGAQLPERGGSRTRRS